MSTHSFQLWIYNTNDVFLSGVNLSFVQIICNLMIHINVLGDRVFWCFFNFSFIFYFLFSNRSTPAMVSIVITSPQTRPISPRCGLKLGLAGKLAC